MANGDFTYTPGSSVTVIVECWGASAQGRVGQSGGPWPGCGGGGGAYARKQMNLTGGTGYLVRVGAANGTPNPAESLFVDAATCWAPGGTNGLFQAPGTGGAAGTGDVKYKGGNGGAYPGDSVTSGTGGGGCGGRDGAGANGSHPSGGTSVGGGNGGDGGGGAGGDGAQPGGGGGGGGSDTVSTPPGAGQDGAVAVWALADWDAPSSQPVFGAVPLYTQGSALPPVPPPATGQDDDSNFVM